MTSQHFEKYLMLLKGFLKLKASQKEDIALELRDHLEHRIEQLIGEGHSPDEAERVAIQEFGDAAGLASSFLNVTRLNRQRWIMRFTTFAIAASFVAILFVMSMWPQNGAVRLASSEAQQPAVDIPDPGGGSQPPLARTPKRKLSGQQATVSKTRSEAEERAIESLKKQVDQFEVVEAPLTETVATLSKMLDVPIIISRKFLDENGIDDDFPITLKIGNARLTTILEMILDDQVGLSDWVYGVKDSVVFIAGEEDVESLMEVRVYECNDFAIASTVTVPIQGGFGFGGGFGGGGFGGGGLGGGGGVPGAGGMSGGGFFHLPPRQFGGFKSKQGVPGGGSTGLSAPGGSGSAQVQPTPQAGAGGSPSEPANGGGGGADAGQPGMNGGMSPGASGGSGMGSGDSGLSGYKTYQTQDLSELIDCIRQTVDSESWDQMGGMGTLNQVGTALVVKQSLKNHDRLEELLTMLRKAKPKK